MSCRYSLCPQLQNQPLEQLGSSLARQHQRDFAPVSMRCLLPTRWRYRSPFHLVPRNPSHPLVPKKQIRLESVDPSQQFAYTHTTIGSLHNSPDEYTSLSSHSSNCGP